MVNNAVLMMFRLVMDRVMMVNNMMMTPMVYRFVMFLGHGKAG